MSSPDHFDQRKFGVRLRTRWLVRGVVVHRIPLCCVLRFSLEREPLSRGRGLLIRDDNAFVPCGLFHHPIDQRKF